MKLPFWVNFDQQKTATLSQILYDFGIIDEFWRTRQNWSMGNTALAGPVLNLKGKSDPYYDPFNGPEFRFITE